MLLLGINCGGSAHGDLSADQMYTNGNVKIRDPRTISNTDDGVEFLTLRYNSPSFGYSLTGLPAGILNVDLGFAETGGETAGARPQDIYYGDTKVFPSFLDVFGQAPGPDRAIIKSFQVNHAAGDPLNLSFVSLAPGKNAFVNSIRVSSFESANIPPFVKSEHSAIENVTLILEGLVDRSISRAEAQLALTLFAATSVQAASIISRLLTGELSIPAAIAELGV